MYHYNVVQALSEAINSTVSLNLLGLLRFKFIRERNLEGEPDYIWKEKISWLISVQSIDTMLIKHLLR